MRRISNGSMGKRTEYIGIMVPWFFVLRTLPTDLFFTGKLYLILAKVIRRCCRSLGIMVFRISTYIEILDRKTFYA